MRRVLHSYSFRIALLYVILFLVSTFILFLFIYLTSTRSTIEQLDQTLLSDRAAFEERYAISGLNGLIRLVNTRAHSQGQDSIYSLISDQQEIIAGNLAAWPVQITREGPVEFSALPYPESSHATGYRGDIMQLPQGYSLLIARSKQRLDSAQRRLINMFSWAAIITLGLGLTGGYYLSKRATRRIANINRLCRTIVDGNISQRLAVVSPAQDDLDDLSLNINSMLDQIEHLMDEIIQVSDNIAHDMRTPLSHLRLKLESTQARAHAVRDAELQAQIGDSIQTADNIIDTFNALLRISKIQASKRKAGFEKLALADLAADVIELYSPLAEDKHQQLDLEIADAAFIEGDRDLLFQALANLLDNAIKYTLDKGTITLTLARPSPKQIELRVCDNGPGVEAKEFAQLSRRFYRVDDSRSQPGNGLGLSLVEAVAALHQGELVFSSAKPQGLCAGLRLPAIAGK